MRFGILVLVALAIAGPPPQAGVVGRIALEKTRFLQGERIFMWLVTERAKDDERPISGAVLEGTRVIYTRPDGTTRIDQPSAPIDGMGINEPGDMGFRGGWTLRDESPQLGRWSVVYELGGRASPPAVFTIEAPDALKKIDTRFEFSTPLVYSANASATLEVRNGSPVTIRFVNLGQNHSIVWGRLIAPGFESSFIVPPDVLARATRQDRAGIIVDRLDWESIKRFPHVTIAPGATWRVTIPLAPWLGQEFGRAGAELSLSTELQMLIGERDGEWRGFSPARLEAKGTTRIQ